MAEFAPGIRSKTDYGDLRTLPTNQLIDYVAQAHNALRAGKHIDLRFGTPDGLFSWALPKGLPEPGKSSLAVRTQLHDYGYKDFQGRIAQGYGAGTVDTADKGRVIIEKASPGAIKFIVAHHKHPSYYTMFRPKGMNEWLIRNTTPVKEEILDTYQKEHLKSYSPEAAGRLLTDDTISSAKIDGAAAIIALLANKAQVYSYVKDKLGRPIVHTERIGELSNLNIPKALQGYMLRGEIYGEHKGKAIPAQELSGILNSSLENALLKKQQQDINLKVALFNILKGKGDEGLAPADKMERLKTIISQINLGGKMIVPEYASGAAASKELLARILSGKHPLTSEGIIAYTNKGPVKIKGTQDSDVVIKNIFRAELQDGEPRAGGFEYTLPNGSEVVGKVGTGFSHATLRDMLQNPQDYIGRTARIKSFGQYPSGAYRAPVFISRHEG